MAEQVFDVTALFYFIFMITASLMTARNTEHAVIVKALMPILVLAELIWMTMYSFDTEWHLSPILLICGLVLGFVSMGSVTALISFLPSVRRLKKERDIKMGRFFELDCDDAAVQLYGAVHKAKYAVAISSIPTAVIAGVLMYVSLLR